MQKKTRFACPPSALRAGVSALVLVGLLAASLPSGCENGEAPPANAEYSVSPPAHPAMRQPASAAGGGAAADPHAAMGAGLPPGHPPVKKEIANASTGEEEATASGSSESDLADRLRRYGIRAVIPAGWTEVPTSSTMRLATLRLSGDDGDAEMSVTALAASQTEEANITRWRGQFQENPEATTATRDASGIQITVTEMEGTFTGSGQPEPDTRLWGAIVRVPGASQLLFFKAWGPKTTLEAWRDSFREFIDSVGPAE